MNRFDEGRRPNTNKLISGGIAAVAIIIFVLIIALGALYSVPEGHVGVKFHKLGSNKGFQPNELGQGIGMKMPFRDRVIDMSFRTQTAEFHSGGKGAFGGIQPKDKNGINFNVDLTVRYRLDGTQASEFVEQKGEGRGAMESLIANAVRADSTRGVFGQHAQEDVPEKRIEIAQEIATVLQARLNQEATGKLKQDFIVVEAVDMRNVQFDARIEEAIVNKQTQKQVAERKEYELQQAEMQKKIEIVNAEKAKEAQLLIADGEAGAILRVATAKAAGIDKVNKAYRGMPQQYVEVKRAEALALVASSGNSVFMDLSRFGGGSGSSGNIGVLSYDKFIPTLQAATE